MTTVYSILLSPNKLYHAISLQPTKAPLEAVQSLGDQRRELYVSIANLLSVKFAL